jgi:hypothetical protein
MPSIASSANGSTHSAHGPTSASQHPSLRHGSAGASVDGRSRASEAAPAAGRESDSGWPDVDRGTGLNPATAGGLVICAENVRDPLLDGIATGDLRAIDALGLRFPSPEMVTAAAALFEPAAPWASGRGRRGTESESGRFRITVGPGVVRLGGPIPSESRKPQNVPSVITNVTSTTRSCKSETTSLSPATMIRPSCVRHDGAIRYLTAAVLAVSSPSGRANHVQRCAAPSPNSTTAHSSSPAVSRP